mmetsp:Transcript_66090/g.186084  ORF Transcript_66090/g.186084 Transcript_66090/m.186084 type:complete len:219 (+) Transcript_66090:1962-2618(+)
MWTTEGEGWHTPLRRDVQRSEPEPRVFSPSSSAPSPTSTSVTVTSCSRTSFCEMPPTLNLDTWSWNETWPQLISGLVATDRPFAVTTTLYLLPKSSPGTPMARKGYTVKGFSTSCERWASSWPVRVTLMFRYGCSSIATVALSSLAKLPRIRTWGLNVTPSSKRLVKIIQRGGQMSVSSSVPSKSVSNPFSELKVSDGLMTPCVLPPTDTAPWKVPEW